MTVMSAIKFLVGIGVVTAPAFVLAAQQQPAPAQNMPGMAQQPAATMAIGECAQAQPRLVQTIDTANTRLEAARQNNSPAAMRAAMDDLQGALGSLRVQLAACAALQAAAPADAHAGMVMPGTPNVQQSPAAQPGAPVMQPGPGAVNRNAPAPAAGSPTDPHAGHVMPGATPAPSSGAPAAQPAPRQPVQPGAQPQGAAPAPGAAAAAGGHAGHAMPAAGNVALVRDPRCTATVNPETAPRAEYAGQNYYFCSERDRQLFVADPVKYLQGAAAASAAPVARATTRPSAAARPAAPPAPGTADPHAGHVMPGAAQPAAPARGTGSPTPARPGASNVPAADPHAGMVMPGATRPSAPAGTSGPVTSPQSGATRAPGATAPPATGAGHAAMAMSSGRMPVAAVTELKCDGRVDPKTAPRMLHGGRMYYFCSVEERSEFAKSPEKYVTAPPSQSAPAHAH